MRQFALFVALASVLSTVNSAAQEVLPLGLRKQLLVDDYALAEIENVTRVLGEVTKENNGTPIFTDGWFYGTVLFHEQKFKMWFRKPGTAGYGYAESADGIQFTQRADVTGINFAGDYTLAVEHDQHASDPAFQFIASYDAPGMAAGIAHSADGISWTPLNDGQPVTGRAADTYNQVLWDELAQTYRLFTRTDFGSAGGMGELRGTRSMINLDIRANPTDWRLVRAWAFDREGAAESQRRQVYALSCWPYESLYFALLSVYEFPGDTSEGIDTDQQRRHERDVMNFYIATSRDANGWDLSWVYASQPLIPRGPDGAFDKDLLLPASTIVTHNDQHWLYYAGGNERHGNERVRFERQHAIGLAKLRLDGFVALAANEQWGTVTTKPFRLQGTNLHVNADARHGEVRVELLDENNEPHKEFAGDRAAVLREDDQVRWPAVWPTEKLAALKNEVVRLRFLFKNARLYSFQVIE